MLTITNTDKLVGQTIKDFRGNEWIITDIKAVGKINTQTKFGWNEYQIDITRSVNYRKVVLFLKRDPFIERGDGKFYEIYYKRGADTSEDYISLSMIKDIDLFKGFIVKMCLSM